MDEWWNMIYKYLEYIQKCQYKYVSKVTFSCYLIIIKYSY